MATTMRTSIKMLAVLLCVLCGQTATITFIQPASVAGDPLLPYLIKQGFEGTGYDNSETWTESGTGTIDEDEATVYASGSQSLEITSSASTDITYTTIGAQGTLYVHFMWHRGNLTGTTTIFSLRAGSSTRARILSGSAGQLSFYHGATSAAITDAVADDTWVHIWLKYVKGTGSDGVAECGWSTDTTRPTSGNKFAAISTGTSTTDIDRVYCGQDASETHTMYFDDVWVDEAGYPQP